MKIYILSCDKINYFETFSSMEDVIKKISSMNSKLFDGRNWYLFGRNSICNIDENDNEEWMDAEYFVDSAVLVDKHDICKYYSFYIRCINEKGEKIELD